MSCCTGARAGGSAAGPVGDRAKSRAAGRSGISQRMKVSPWASLGGHDLGAVYQEEWRNGREERPKTSVRFRPSCTALLCGAAVPVTRENRVRVRFPVFCQGGKPCHTAGEL